MWRPIAFFLTVLIAYGVESRSLFGVREVATKPVAYPEIVGSPAIGLGAGIDAAGLAFPPPTHPCFTQIKDVYHAAVIRTIAIMHSKAINNAVPDANIVFGASPYAKDWIAEELIARNAFKALAIVRKMSWMAVRELTVLQEEARLTEPAVIGAVNKIINLVIKPGAICHIEAGVLTLAVDSAIAHSENSMEIGIPSMITNGLGSEIPIAVKSKMEASMAPIVEACHEVIKAVKIDILTDAVSTKPITALAKALDLMSTTTKQSQVLIDPTLAGLLAEHSLTGYEPLVNIPSTVLAQIVGHFIAEMEMVVPITCRSAIAARLAGAFIPTIVESGFIRAKTAVSSIMQNAVAKISMMPSMKPLNIEEAVTALFEREEATIISRLAPVTDTSVVAEIANAIPVGWRTSTLATTLPVVKARVLAVIKKEVTKCGVVQPSSNAMVKQVLVELPTRIHAAFGPAAVRSWLSGVVGVDNMAAMAGVETEVMAPFEDLLNDVAIAIKPITSIEDMDVIRDWFVKQIVRSMVMTGPCAAVGGCAGIAGISGADAAISGAAAGISGAAAGIFGADAAISGTAAGISGATAGIDGTAAGISGAAAGISGVDAAISGSAGIAGPDGISETAAGIFAKPEIGAYSLIAHPMLAKFADKYAETLRQVLATNNYGPEARTADIGPIVTKVVETIILKKEAETVPLFGMDVTPGKGIFAAPAFQKEFQIRLATQLLPMATIPTNLLKMHIAEAYIKTVHDLGLAAIVPAQDLPSMRALAYPAVPAIL